MQRYFGKTVRVKQTTFSLRDDSTAMNPKIEADMETIAHLWSGQILIVRYVRTTPASQSRNNFSSSSAHNLLAGSFVERLSYALLCQYIPRQLYKTIQKPNEFIVFLEDPRAKPITVINCFRWNESVTLLIDLISQSFSSASIVSAFRLVIAFNSKIVHGSEVRQEEFRQENQTTNEFLQLKDMTEKEVIDICGEWIIDDQHPIIDEINAKRHILVQRSRL